MGDYYGLLKLAKEAKKKNRAGLASTISGGALLAGAGGTGVAAKRFNEKYLKADKSDSRAYGKLIHAEGKANKAVSAASSAGEKLKSLQARHEDYLKEMKKTKSRWTFRFNPVLKKKYRELNEADSKIWGKIPMQTHKAREARGVADVLTHNADVLSKRHSKLSSIANRLKKNKRLAIGSTVALGLLGTGLIAKGIHDRNKSKK